MISASKIELVTKCEGALALPQRDERNAYQDAGNERHEQLEDDIAAGRIPEVLEARWPGYTWRSEVAYAIDVATGKGRVLGVRIQRNYEAFDLGPFEITGTADLEGRGPSGELAIVDRKSYDPNVSRAAVNGQVHTLALAASRAFGVDDADVAIWHEVRPLDVHHLDVFDLDTYLGELRGIFERAAAARGRVRAGIALTLVTGEHCRWCAAFSNCEAQQALALDVHSGNADMRIAMLLPLADDESAANAYEFWKRVKMLSKRLGDALHARAGEKPIPLGDGRWFGKVASKGNEKLDGDVTYEAVRKLHGQGIADAAVERTATKAKIKEALGMANVPSVAAAERAVLDLVRASGGSKRESGESIKEFTHQLAAVNE